MTIFCFLDNDLIDFDEFVAIMIKCSPKDIEEQLHQAFSLLDKDGNGTISADELRQVGEYISWMEEDRWLFIMNEIWKVNIFYAWMKVGEYLSYMDKGGWILSRMLVNIYHAWMEVGEYISCMDEGGWIYIMHGWRWVNIYHA